MPFYITTPIYYPNSSPHIGTAYTTVACDAIARLRRLKGEEVYFLTGTDENAQKIVRQAESAGQEPLNYVNEIVAKFKSLWELFDISNDDFIRTTEERHAKVVQAMFTKLSEQDDIYKSEYEGWYCTPCETFWPQTKLVDGNCPNADCGRPVELLKEESYFFRLSKYQDKLLAHIASHPDFIRPASRRNEMVRFIEGGLEDLCVSRTTFSWGIKVPFDPKHVVYVWLDALINYVSALGYPDDPKYAKFWPADIHMMGKDIVRFHAIIWPTLLMALDLPLPRQVFGHGWFIDKAGSKIAKSRGNVQDAFELLRRYGADALRYYLLREMQFGADGTYSEDDLVERINKDLANDLGNYVARALAMLEKYEGGVVPAPGGETTAERELQAVALAAWQTTEEKLLTCDPAGALDSLWTLVSKLNKYVDEAAPWTLAKKPEDRERLHTVLYTLVEGVRVLGILCAPFMPGVPRRLAPLLGGAEHFAAWENAGKWGLTQPGTTVKKGEALFPRIDPEAFATAEADQDATRTAVPAPSAQTTAPEPVLAEAVKPLIEMEDFSKVDLRVVRVLSAEKVPKTDKLLRLEVELSGETRTVVSGIAANYAPEDLVGQYVVLVANLAPAKLRGIVSEGMILAAATADGALEVLTLAKTNQTGAIVR
jgi:methionyl-tRNA synthetase